MGFFDFLKNKPNEKKEEPKKENIQTKNDIASALQSQLNENEQMTNSILQEIDDLMAECDRRLEEQEKNKEQ